MVSGTTGHESGELPSQRSLDESRATARLFGTKEGTKQGDVGMDSVLMEAFADAFGAAEKVFRERLAVIGAVTPPPQSDVVSRARALHPQLGERQAEVL